MRNLILLFIGLSLSHEVYEGIDTNCPTIMSAGTAFTGQVVISDRSRFLAHRKTIIQICFTRDYHLHTVCHDICVDDNFKCIAICDPTDSKCVNGCLRAEVTCVESKHVCINIIYIVSFRLSM